MINLSLYDVVRKLLIEKPYLKDNDNALAMEIWENEMKTNKLILGIFGFSNFKNHFVNNKLTAYETIRRARQKAQQEYPELRGITYGKRYRYAERYKEEILSPEYKKSIP